MPTAYELELLNKKFRGNIVIRILGTYFAISSPDSGLVISYPYSQMVKSLVLSPTQVDLQRTNQTIATYSFKIIDKNNLLTALVKDRGDALVGQDVEIWVGRITGSFDFSNYFKLPVTKIKKISHEENAYYFSSSDSIERMNLPVFNLNGKLAASVLTGTTVFTLVEAITDWPTSGTARLDNEFFSWTGKNNTLKHLTGITRGQKSTTPVAHDAGVTVYRVYDVQDNPLTILLKLLISGGGGGTYDVYPDGLGIDENLIDVAGIEAIRDSLFFAEQFSYSLYSIDSALKFIQDEILIGCNCRFVVSNDSKISLAVLDQSVFGEAPETIDENTIASYPKWEVDDNDIYNVLEIQWDWSESTQQFLKVNTYRDADSIAVNGERKPRKIALKGPKASLSGQAIVDDRSTRFLVRFSTPNPEVSFKTHVDKHLLTVGSKVLVQSSQIPYITGTLQFATELEIVSRGINLDTGDVQFKLAFTSYSGIRPCYISPSDIGVTIIDQKTIEVPAGRGDCYTVGWKMRLWDIAAIGYTADATNEIASIVGDVVTFVDDFVTTLTDGNFRIKFCDYDEATQDQKRYCFISDAGLDFPDGASTYRITF